MDAVTAITGAGSLIRAATGFVGALLTRRETGSTNFAAQLRKQAEANAAKFVQARDRDGSGGLNKAELGVDDRLFTRLDVNGDGQVTPAELAATGNG
ncbi:MAG: hypothetical protein NTZ09_14360 [Candidatus Hydrogenedentes bacterium]|nr:hypothetical protein [Candidatus Hydrogenedentota bacterium]